MAYTKAAWHQVERKDYLHNWHIEAIAEHLEAVSRREIKRLIINVPFRTTKSTLVSVMWPTWTWTWNPAHQFLVGSHAEKLAIRDNLKHRRITQSEWYRDRWGHLFGFTSDQNQKTRFENDQTGYRIAFGMTSGVTGDGADTLLIDDPLDRLQAASDAEREKANEIFDETLISRLNEPEHGAIVIIMQRLHTDDLSGHLLETGDWEHLMLPMEFDSSRKCVTSLGFEDPRSEDGELLWPARFPREVVDSLKKTLGPAGAAGQLQQSPEIKGGGIIRREWWNLWEDNYFPDCQYRWAFADTAYTTKEENDPTGFTLWGLFHQNGDPKVVLMDAWRKRLEIHGPNKWIEADRAKTERLKRVCSWIRGSWAFYEANPQTPRPIIEKPLSEKEFESRYNTGVIPEPWASYIEFGYNSLEAWPNEPRPIWTYRTQENWGLCEWLAHSCQKHQVHKLIVEAKASGLSVIQELKRLHGSEGWGIEAQTPEGDKVARANAVQSVFSQGLVYAPDREWAQMVIEETAVFPRGRYKDLTDSTTGALKHIRESGLLISRDERLIQERESSIYRPPEKNLYQV